MRIRLLDCLHPHYCPAGSEGRLVVEEAGIGEIRIIELFNGERWALGKARFVEIGPSKLDQYIKATYRTPPSPPASGMRRVKA